jgi:outer membrane protein OmpA-like peptidoglycan-associated protein
MQALGHRRSSPLARLRLLVALAPLWLLAACGTPDNLFVLLPNEDGSVGQIEIASTTGSQTLDTAQQATGLNRAGQAPVEPFALTAEEIQTTFGQALAAQPAPPQVFILYFRTGTTELVPDSQAQLPGIIGTVTGRTAPDVSVVGHTDRAGTDELNLGLSLDRAESVRDALVAAGLTIERIEVTSHGENNPLIPTADGVSEPRNRRVEVTVR